MNGMGERGGARPCEMRTSFAGAIRETGESDTLHFETSADGAGPKREGELE